jgi:hypothetical protein
MNKKKLKIAIITFVVLGVTGVAILKGKTIVDKIRAKRRAKNGTSEKAGSFSKLFDLPDDLK